MTPGGDDEPEVNVFPFYDVSVSLRHCGEVKYIWANGLMNGTGTVELSTNTTLNYAMVWMILAHLDGVDADGGATWCSKAQEWAMAEGVSDDADQGGAVTRKQLVTMLWRYMDESQVNFQLTVPDSDEPGNWGVKGMGIIEAAKTAASPHCHRYPRSGSRDIHEIYRKITAVKPLYSKHRMHILLNTLRTRCGCAYGSCPVLHVLLRVYTAVLGI